MARYRLIARAVGVVALATATVAPLMVTPTASAIDDSPWIHAVGVGNNTWGQLGNGAPTFRETVPTAVKSSTQGFRQVSGGDRHSLAIAADGTVYAWGSNSTGQLGNPDAGPVTRLPVPVVGLSGITQVSAGTEHSLALRSDGSVWAWGLNLHGQLGLDGRGPNVPTRVPLLSGIRAIAAGGHHSLALKLDGTVLAFGNNRSGQLGTGSTEPESSTPTVVPGLTSVVEIDAGESHSVALRSTLTGFRSVWNWGDNLQGQLGDNTNDERNLPVRVVLFFDVSAIAAGRWHTLAVRADGRVWAWGMNSSRQLGDGTDEDQHGPVPVLGLTNARAVTAGGPFSAALHQDGSVSVWGTHRFGPDDRFTPVRIGGFAGVSQLSAGGGYLLAAQPVPAPRFTVSLGSSAGTLAAGGALRIPVTTAAVNESTHTIRLSVSGLPAGVTAAFEPPTVVAGGSSTLVLSGTEQAALGPATLTVTATAEPATPYPTTVTASFALTVVAGCAATNDTDLPIPDAGPPATSLAVLTGCADEPDLTGSTVEVHIVHSRRGDVVIDLIDPNGRTFRLKNSNPTDTRPNINARFPIVIDPDLHGRLDGSEWQLRVQDAATGAVGHVNSWTLHP